MNKKERNQKIKAILNKSGANFVVLDIGRFFDNGSQEWRHVRVDGFGDVWPNTGTYRQGNRWHKRNFEKLVSALESHFNLSDHDGEVLDTRETQELILNELLKRVEDLEVKVYQLENKV